MQMERNNQKFVVPSHKVEDEREQEIVAQCPSFTKVMYPDAVYQSKSTKIDITEISDLDLVRSIYDGTQTIAFSTPLQKRQVPTNWFLWSSPPFAERSNPSVLFNQITTTLTMTLSVPVKMFGFEIEPDQRIPIEFKAIFLSKGIPVGSITRSVNGAGCARLFAAEIDCTCSAIDEVIITGSDTFAIAQFRYIPYDCNQDSDHESENKCKCKHEHKYKHECGCKHEHKYKHECGCKHEYKYKHECGCKHEHKYEHECGCKHEHKYEHECGCKHEHKYKHECECKYEPEHKCKCKPEPEPEPKPEHKYEHECECKHGHQGETCGPKKADGKNVTLTPPGCFRADSNIVRDFCFSDVHVTCKSRTKMVDICGVRCPVHYKTVTVTGTATVVVFRKLDGGCIGDGTIGRSQQIDFTLECTACADFNCADFKRSLAADPCDFLDVILQPVTGVRNTVRPVVVINCDAVRGAGQPAECD